jgi:hypothetical protein
MKFLMYLILAIFVINFGKFFVYTLKTELDNQTVNADGQELIQCPTDGMDSYAIEVRKGYPYAGHYVACKDFDTFYEALAKNQLDEAKKFLLGYDKKL